MTALLLPSVGSVEPIAEMTARLAPRGPDDVGFALWPSAMGGLEGLGGEDTPAGAFGNAPGAPRAHWRAGAGARRQFALGHRRLAIIDESPHGHQPMASACGRFVVSYNGEIYNYRELRARLEGEGHPFRSVGDTEVLLAAWARWGPACLRELIGMWAFVLVDLERREYFAVRDPFGIKPLFHARWGGGLALASELKALLALPGSSRAVDPRALFDYLRHGHTDHGEGTLYRDARQVPAGTLLQGSLDAPAVFTSRAYWREGEAPRVELDRAAAAARLRELFLESVELHLRSDVPLGAALSGGIDSSAIVCAIRHLRPQVELHTFSYAAGDPAVSEEVWAARVARHARARRHVVRIEAGEFARDLDRLIALQDVPFAATSMYAQLRVFERARAEGVRVVLNGQGGDELLAGYAQDVLPVRVEELLRCGEPRAAARLLRHALRLPGLSRRQLLAQVGARLSPVVLERPLRALARREAWPAWLVARWFRDRGVDGAGEGTARSGLRECLRRARWRTNLPMLLRFDDRNSMACSVESRVPFLTTPLAEFLEGLPVGYLLDERARTKSIFREAMRGLMPDAVLDRADKVGFATPERAWLGALSPWVDALMARGVARAVPALDVVELRAEWARVQAGQRRFDHRVWRWVNLLRWAELVGPSFE